MELSNLCYRGYPTARIVIELAKTSSGIADKRTTVSDTLTCYSEYTLHDIAESHLAFFNTLMA